jgi:hypothetical protein
MKTFVTGLNPNGLISVRKIKVVNILHVVQVVRRKDMLNVFLLLKLNP